MDSLPADLIGRVLEEGGVSQSQDVDALSTMSRNMKVATQPRRDEISRAKSLIKRVGRMPYVKEEYNDNYPNPLGKAIYDARTEAGGGSLLKEDGTLKARGKSLKFFVDGRRGNTLVDGFGRPIDRGRQRVNQLVPPPPVEQLPPPNVYDIDE